MYRGIMPVLAFCFVPLPAPAPRRLFVRAPFFMLLIFVVCSDLIIVLLFTGDLVNLFKYSLVHKRNTIFSENRQHITETKVDA